MTDALTLAKYIVMKCVRDNCPINNLHLQQILYYIQIDSLRRTEIPAFSDDMEAWRFGPCVPDVYYYFCGNGGLPIVGDINLDEQALWELEVKFGWDFELNKVIEDKRRIPSCVLMSEIWKNSKAWKFVWDNEGSHMIISMSTLGNLDVKEDF